jgi:glycosyltransferase involved in cell wall biosynthesis
MATITIDARMITSGGIGTYLQTLLADLLQESSPHKYLALLTKTNRQTLTPTARLAVKHIYGALYSPIAQLTVLLATPSHGLLHVPHYNLPLAFPGPVVTTVHDLIHLQFPQNFVSPLAALYARLYVLAATSKASAIITGSRATKRLLIELCRVPEKKIHVIPYKLPDRLLTASRDMMALSGLGLDPLSYFLYVGQLKIHKNIPALLSAFAQFSQKHPSIRLVMVAYAPSGRMQLRASIAEKKLTDRIMLLDRVSFPTLKTLYQQSLALVLPSLAEGFGLPVIEAMALGTPVIASDIPALAEAAGDAALLVDPGAPEEFCHAMSTVAFSPALRAELVRRGYDRAAIFATSQIGRATQKVYESFL